MLSIVNYGSSDSEEEISDEENVIRSNSQQNGSKTEEVVSDLLQKSTTINLPQPSVQKSSIAEEDDEFLHKKEIPKVVPPPTKTKVKIMIPRLSEFKDDDDDEKKQAKVLPVNKKSGLLNMLPKPSHSFAPAPKPQTPANAPQLQPPSLKLNSLDEKPSEATKKIGLIPYSLMSHKPKATDGKKPAKAKDESDDEDDEPVSSFFTFSSNDDELPKVNEDEIKALVEKEAARIEQRKRQHEQAESEPQEEIQSNSYDQYDHDQQPVDEEALKALLGGNKAKRSKIDNIQFIDLSAAEVMPNREEWKRKTLAGETSYQPTGHITEKVRNLITGSMSDSLINPLQFF